jgi:hypothetical protein
MSYTDFLPVATRIENPEKTMILIWDTKQRLTFQISYIDLLKQIKEDIKLCQGENQIT